MKEGGGGGARGKGEKEEEREGEEEEEEGKEENSFWRTWCVSPYVTHCVYIFSIILPILVGEGAEPVFHGPHGSL